MSDKSQDEAIMWAIISLVIGIFLIGGGVFAQTYYQTYYTDTFWEGRSYPYQKYASILLLLGIVCTGIGVVGVFNVKTCMQKPTV